MYISKEDLAHNIVKITLGRENNTKKAKAVGAIELDIETQARFVDMINRIFESDTKKLIVDMGNVNYIDSSGLWALFEGHKKSALKEGKMVLLNTPKEIQRVLEITKMSIKIVTYYSEKDAVNALKKLD